MSWLGDLWDWNVFAGKDILSNVGDDPERLLFGSADPFSTKLWNGILGRDDEPIISQLGGATDEAFERGEAEGIDTDAGRQMQGVADTVAMAYGSAGAMNGLGNAFGGGSGVSAGGGSSGGAISDFGDAGYGIIEGGGVTPVGSDGAIGAVASGGGGNWENLGRLVGNSLGGGGGQGRGSASGEAQFKATWDDASGGSNKQLLAELEKERQREQQALSRRGTQRPATYAGKVASVIESEADAQQRAQQQQRLRNRVVQQGISETTDQRWGRRGGGSNWNNLSSYMA